MGNQLDIIERLTENIIATRYEHIPLEAIEIEKQDVLDVLGALIAGATAPGCEVVSVSCKCGSVPKEELGFEEWEKIRPGSFEPMCHPIAQAEILNSYNTDLNIMVCLCVGHDSIFLKNSKAPCTVLAAKDRVFGHAPLLALYLSRSYHRRVMAKHTEPDAYKQAERAK